MTEESEKVEQPVVSQQPGRVKLNTEDQDNLFDLLEALNTVLNITLPELEELPSQKKIMLQGAVQIIQTCARNLKDLRGLNIPCDVLENNMVAYSFRRS